MKKIYTCKTLITTRKYILNHYRKWSPLSTNTSIPNQEKMELLYKVIKIPSNNTISFNIQAVGARYKETITCHN